MAKRPGTFQIVLARNEDAYRPIGTWRHDLGERPEMERYDNPKSLMWKSDGGDDDIAKAKTFAQSEGYRVFVYESTERDPLGRAKREVLTPESRVSAPKPPAAKKEKRPPGVPLAARGLTGISARATPGTIYESHTMDYTSRIHHAMRADGQWFARYQYRDPRYGYKWGEWKESAPPASLSPAGYLKEKRANLPGGTGLGSTGKRSAANETLRKEAVAQNMEARYKSASIGEKRARIAGALLAVHQAHIGNSVGEFVAGAARQPRGPVQTGPRGGKFIVSASGKRWYPTNLN